MVGAGRSPGVWPMQRLVFVAKGLGERFLAYPFRVYMCCAYPYSVHVEGSQRGMFNARKPRVHDME